MDTERKTPDTTREIERRGRLFATRGGTVRDPKFRSVNAEEFNIQSEDINVGAAGQITAVTSGSVSNLIFNALGSIIQVIGGMMPSVDNTYSLGNSISLGGSSDRGWKYVISNNPHVTLSDRRFKRDIEDLAYGLEQIEGLRPVSYRQKNDERKNVGLIAQELKEIVPEAVVGEGDQQHFVMYEQLIPVLINAVQELSERVKTLEGKT